MNLLIKIILCVVMCSIKCSEAKLPIRNLVCYKRFVPKFAFLQDEMQRNKTVTFNEQDQDSNKYTDHSMLSILFDHKIPRLAELTYSDLVEKTIVDDDTIPEEDFHEDSCNLTEDFITFSNEIRIRRDNTVSEINTLRMNVIGDAIDDQLDSSKPDHTVVEMEDAVDTDDPGGTKNNELPVNTTQNRNNRNNSTNENIENDSMRDDDQEENENEEESNDKPPDLDLEEQSLLMKITRKLVESLSLTYPGRLTPSTGGSHLLHFKNIQIYFGEELDLELKQYLESLRYKYEDNPDLYLNNVVVILHHGQNLHIMRNSKIFTDYWDSNCPSIREKLDILKKLYPKHVRDYTAMITSLLSDWKTALNFLQNRLEQV